MKTVESTKAAISLGLDEIILVLDGVPVEERTIAKWNEIREAMKSEVIGEAISALDASGLIVDWLSTPYSE